MARGQGIRVLFASGALLAALAQLPVAHAESLQPDEATVAAIASWRAAAVALVNPVYQDVVAASYMDRRVTTDGEWFNKAMVARAQAEQQAFASLDAASATLIRNYYSPLDASSDRPEA